jgi:citronellyl-CoA dehydrogenase
LPLGRSFERTAMARTFSMRIPARYRLGEENMGFMYLMQNFQTECLVAGVSAVSGAFLMIEDAIAYGRERSAFGKPISGCFGSAAARPRR